MIFIYLGLSLLRLFMSWMFLLGVMFFKANYEKKKKKWKENVPESIFFVSQNSVEPFTFPLILIFFFFHLIRDIIFFPLQDKVINNDALMEQEPQVVVSITR